MSNISNEFTLIFTGQNRSASAVLLNSEEDGRSAIDNLIRIREQADEAREFILSGDLSKLGILLNEAWSMKRGISSNISNDFLDEMFSRIMS